jgi:hypothetical protein
MDWLLPALPACDPSFATSVTRVVARGGLLHLALHSKFILGVYERH